MDHPFMNQGRHFIDPHPWTRGAKIKSLILTKSIKALIRAFLFRKVFSWQGIGLAGSYLR